ncbi:hypothetical protein IAU59_004874 [Kwoniella sp. CBS 9459]
MESDNKHEHIPSPQGPEDASNIADEYPSPEREAPPTLHDHDHDHQADQQEANHDGTTTPAVAHGHEQQHHDHPQEREEIDMQTEFANQVAAQAIEAAVAAEARASANARAHASIQEEEEEGSRAGPSSSNVEQQPLQPQTQDTLATSQQGEHADHMQSHTIRSQHHPRQPTFPRARSTLSYPLPSPSQHHAASSQIAHVRSESTPSELPQHEQIAILREAYAKNPNPGKKELESLAERTGRPWNKIREYFRQRRNKLRGLEDLENMEEPGRASGWLQVAYRAAAPNAHVTQLSLYNSYKHRFDPYSITTPLLGGQELIQLACATFPGCEMAKDEGDYVLKGLKEKEKEAENENERDEEEWEKGMEGLVEPLRAGSWLLSSFQHQSDPSAPSTLTQTDLYTSYAARFSTLLTNAGASSSQEHHLSNDTANGSQLTAEEVRAAQDQAAELKAFEDAGLGESGANDDENDTRAGQEQEGDASQQQDGQDVDMGTGGVEDHQSLAQLALLPQSVPGQHEHQVGISPDSATSTPQPHQPGGPPAPTNTSAPLPAHVTKRENRLLNPFELINLTRMTFPKCEPSVDASGRFIIRGLTRREGHEPGARSREREMFPFALMNEAKPGDAFVGLMKRKLELLNPEPSPEAQRNQQHHGSTSGADDLGSAPADSANKRARLTASEGGTNGNGNGGTGGDGDQELTEEDRELVEGLKRFRGSKLGEQVRDACISQ